jgi:hypothetical protein
VIKSLNTGIVHSSISEAPGITSRSDRGTVSGMIRGAGLRLRFVDARSTRGLNPLQPMPGGGGDAALTDV